MFKEVDRDRNAIVVVGYNRVTSISRLLSSLNTAYYEHEVPLVISIDCSRMKKLYDFVEDFKWKHGNKYVIIQEKRLGLKDHIFFCGGLSQYFKSVTILEDDLFVSPFFYHYVEKAVEIYGQDSRVAGISLYKNELNGFAGLPASYLNNGNDVFAFQSTSTWGETFTYSMWSGFRKWLDSWDENFDEIDMLQAIKDWDRAWSKYYEAYLVAYNIFFIYPVISVSTNFSDAGVHVRNGKCNNTWQTELLLGVKNWQMGDVDNLVKYDTYFNLMGWKVGLGDGNVGFDLYGNRENIGQFRYLVSVRQLPYKIVKRYGIRLRPIENNLFFNVDGDGIYVYDMTTPCNNQYVETPQYFLMEYYLRNMNVRYLRHYLQQKVIDRLKRYVFR